MKHIINTAISKLYALTLIITVALLSASCEHKELYMYKAQKQLVNIRINWDKLLPGDTKPEGVTLYFYNDRDGEMQKYDIPASLDEYPLSIYSGIYNVIAYNNDAPALFGRFPNEYDKHELLAMELNNQVPQTYVCHCTVEVEHHDEDEVYDNQVITITPEPMYSIYNVVAKNTDAVSGAITFMASLSGLTNCIYAASGDCSNNSTESVIAFPLIKAGNSNSHINTIKTFGQLVNEKNPVPSNKLLLTVLKDDKTVVYYLFNVADQIKAATNRKNVTIEVDLKEAKPLQPGDPDYPKVDPEVNEGGINAGVDDFGNENIDVIV